MFILILVIRFYHIELCAGTIIDPLPFKLFETIKQAYTFNFIIWDNNKEDQISLKAY